MGKTKRREQVSWVRPFMRNRFIGNCALHFNGSIKSGGCRNAWASTIPNEYASNAIDVQSVAATQKTELEPFCFWNLRRTEYWRKLQRVLRNSQKKSEVTNLTATGWKNAETENAYFWRKTTCAPSITFDHWSAGSTPSNWKMPEMGSTLLPTQTNAHASERDLNSEDHTSRSCFRKLQSWQHKTAILSIVLIVESPRSKPTFEPTDEWKHLSIAEL